MRCHPHPSSPPPLRVKIFACKVCRQRERCFIPVDISSQYCMLRFIAVCNVCNSKKSFQIYIAMLPMFHIAVQILQCYPLQTSQQLH
jgi:hypothetical protein